MGWLGLSLVLLAGQIFVPSLARANSCFVTIQGGGLHNQLSDAELEVLFRTNEWARKILETVQKDPDSAKQSLSAIEITNWENSHQVIPALGELFRLTGERWLVIHEPPTGRNYLFRTKAIGENYTYLELRDQILTALEVETFDIIATTPSVKRYGKHLLIKMKVGPELKFYDDPAVIGPWGEFNTGDFIWGPEYKAPFHAAAKKLNLGESRITEAADSLGR